MEQIKFGKYVSLAYEILVAGDTEEVSVFEFTAQQPDAFVFGMDQSMLESFKNKIEGLAQGDKFDFTLAPAEAFGERMDEYVMDLDKKIFHNGDGEFDSERVFPGAMVPMNTAQGGLVHGRVLDITDDTVKMDFNHQLAGETIHYKGEVLEVRDSTPEERNPQGCGSCCGNCGSCGDNGGDCEGGCGSQHD